MSISAHNRAKAVATGVAKNSKAAEPKASTRAGSAGGSAKGEPAEALEAVPAAPVSQWPIDQRGNESFAKLVKSAGTLHAKELQKLIGKGKLKDVPGDTVVEGPNVFSKAFKNGHDPIRELLTHEIVKLTFAMSTDKQRQWFGTDSHVNAVKGSDVASLADEIGPDGLPRLMPGDIIVNGIDHHEKDGSSVPHIGHASMYVGKQKNGKPDENGEPTIIHAMATSTTDQTIGGNLLQVLKEDVVPPPPGKGKGVIKESVEGFFERFGRENYAVIRLNDDRVTDPKLRAEMQKRGLQALEGAVGKPYDLTLRKGPYCSYLAKVYQEAAYEGTGLQPPPIGTTWENGVGAWVIEPENIVASRNATVTAGNSGGLQAVQNVLRNHVVANAK